MKKFVWIILITSLAVIKGLFAQEAPSKEYKANYEQVMKRTEWWRNSRFGMFIHFGAYAVPARGEWVKSRERLTTEQYQKYIDDFNPIDFDAKAWAKTAKAAGMKYAVLTAKHHDGFCLFDSKLTDYKLSTRFGGRDLVREFLDAFRGEGLKVGLYYSIIDWHHPEYPNVGNHPQRDHKEYSKRIFNWDNYLKYMHGQVEELVKNYGKIDIMWFDYSFDQYSGEKWKAKELVDMVRKYQPEIILDNRLATHEGSSSKQRMVKILGDFETPEQGIPDVPLVDKYGNPVPWETCLTLNGGWGYTEQDHNWKSPELIIHSLVNCVSKNGNLLLNVGPDARGNIPEESIGILTEVGKWMDKSGESIYGCGSSNLTKPDWGRFTQKGNTVYAHWLYPNLGQLNAKGVDSGNVKNVYMLKSGAELPYQNTWWSNTETGNFFITVGSSTEKPVKYDTVVKIVLKN
ncbi:MAG: alpha-L-fucosidase [Prolixibacteraceae bacterium]|jgi:alpha-L-fucosidase|nr:alpha-L-fucosidase [Prolixibacteraceae bacterium]